ncbi:MAG: TIR domain-containing protein [Candidatus Hydrogenedens sp.]|nr:TIR domain-containing protein [Candidatus Hydrogenedens sp.]
MNISRITRESILKHLVSRKIKFYGEIGILEFLNKIWDLKSLPSYYGHRYDNLYDEIWQHMVINDDWDAETLLKGPLNILECDDETFINFIENSIHPEVIHSKDNLMDSFFQIRSFLRNDGYKLKKRGEISGIPEFRVEKERKQIGDEYDIALSYASEQRDYVEKVGSHLNGKGVKVFLDIFEEVNMWGKNLPEFFQEIFGGEKTQYFCVIFISKEYSEKWWTKYEFNQALTREIKEKKLFVLPARFDNSELKGLPQTISYIDLTRKSPEKFAEMIMQKLIDNIE